MLAYACISLFSSGNAVDTHSIILLTYVVYIGALLSSRTVSKLLKNLPNKIIAFLMSFEFSESPRQIITGNHMKFGKSNKQELS